MGHGQVKEHREALLTPPGARIQPAQKTKVRWLRSKVLVAILGHDFVDMIVAHLALEIAGENRRISDIELSSKCQDHHMGNVGRIGQECSQKPNGTELEGKAQARMIVTARL